MEITLPSDLERYVEDLVALGEYETPEAAVLAGLARMQGADDDSEADRERLRAMVQEGIDDLEAGRARDGEEVMRELRQRFERMALEEKAQAA